MLFELIIEHICFYIPVVGDCLAVDDCDVALCHAALVLGHASVAARPRGTHVLDRQVEPPETAAADSALGRG